MSTAFDSPETGQAMWRLAERLFPIFRAVTGDGVRQTLEVLAELLPLDIHEVPSGTQAFDWTIPEEWNVRDAFIADATGTRVVDFQERNLHLVGGSVPVHRRMPWAELKQHLYTLPDRPDWIPYRNGYPQREWGFCLSQRQYDRLAARGDDEVFEVVIDSSYTDGSLTYGECLLPGELEDEILISAHVCHPSLANDNLSGIVIAAHLAARVAGRSPRLSYRFLFAPATWGAIAWLSRNEETVDKVEHGLVLSCLGDAGPFTYRRSRREDAVVDRAAAAVLAHREGASVRPFIPFGYDQRQFCSPGFDLPVGCLMRTPNGEYPEYHTSADNLALISADSLQASLDTVDEIFQTVEQNATLVNQNPKCEPQLGRRGLYRGFDHGEDVSTLQQAVMWTLNLADGTRDLLAIAERSGLPPSEIRRAAKLLEEHRLLAPKSDA